jgi:ribose transport system substrate-binding protein
MFNGCGKREEAPSVTEKIEKPETSWVIGMSQCNLGEPWRVQMNHDIKMAAEEHPEIKMIFKDAQNDSLKQRSQIEEFTSAGVDLIIVSPKEAAPLTPPIATAYEKGIPVIVLDRRVLGDKYTCFIGADNKRIGKAAGKWIAERLNGHGKIVELKGLMTSTPGQYRHTGFREGIKGTDIEVIFEADMKWLEPNARREMESALARFEKIDLVYAHNDPGAHGAYLAAKASGREKDIIFVGIDALPQEGQVYVKQGIMEASFEYPTGGRESIAIALDILSGKKVPKEITLASRVFTKDNIDKGGEWLKEEKISGNGFAPVQIFHAIPSPLFSAAAELATLRHPRQTMGTFPVGTPFLLKFLSKYMGERVSFSGTSPLFTLEEQFGKAKSSKVALSIPEYFLIIKGGGL